jgi:hypothetical protein
LEDGGQCFDRGPERFGGSDVAHEKLAKIWVERRVMNRNPRKRGFFLVIDHCPQF